MKYISYDFSFKTFAFGFSISRWSWNLDLGFFWIGGEW